MIHKAEIQNISRQGDDADERSRYVRRKEKRGILAAPLISTDEQEYSQSQSSKKPYIYQNVKTMFFCLKSVCTTMHTTPSGREVIYFDPEAIRGSCMAGNRPIFKTGQLRCANMPGND